MRLALLTLALLTILAAPTSANALSQARAVAEVQEYDPALIVLKTRKASRNVVRVRVLLPDAGTIHDGDNLSDIEFADVQYVVTVKQHRGLHVYDGWVRDWAY